VHPILLKIGSMTIYSYGFMLALGFLASIILACFLARKISIKPENILDVAMFVFIGAIIGARTFYVIFFWYEIRNPWEAFMIWNGGLIFYGGLVFGLLGLIWACKIFKISVMDMLDIATPATFLGYAIGRIGCFLNGCCYGVKCSLPWAVEFPHLLELRHPTQIYASISGFIIMGILLFLFYRRKFQGQIFALGIIFYPSYRFLIDFIRDNTRYLFGLTNAQIGSIFIIIFGLILYGIFSRRVEIK